jgi:phage shock protein A
LAEIKSMAIRARKDVSTYQQQARDYEQKAMNLLQRSEQGQLDQAEAERLATEALNRKEQAEQQLAQAKKEKEKYEQSASKMDANVRSLRSQITKYENELKTLRARQRVSSATEKLNKQMAQIDSSSTVSMLERMREKVEKQESMAESYGEIANESKSVDDEIDQALGSSGGSGQSSSAQLEDLKARMRRQKQLGGA